MQRTVRVNAAIVASAVRCGEAGCAASIEDTNTTQRRALLRGAMVPRAHASLSGVFFFLPFFSPCSLVRTYPLCLCALSRQARPAVLTPFFLPTFFHVQTQEPKKKRAPNRSELCIPPKNFPCIFAMPFSRIAAQDRAYATQEKKKRGHIAAGSLFFDFGHIFWVFLFFLLICSWPFFKKKKKTRGVVGLSASRVCRYMSHMRGKK